MRFSLVESLGRGDRGCSVHWPNIQWPALSPSFQRPTYRLSEGTLRERDDVDDAAHSTRGVRGAGELDIACVADTCAATLSIAESGLSDYCLTLVTRGTLTCSGMGGCQRHEVTTDTGLIYRGTPGTTLSASRDHERIAIRIPAASMRQRVTNMLGGPVYEDVSFDPVFMLEAPAGQQILSLVYLLLAERDPGDCFGENALACRSFADLLLYTMLGGLPNTYSRELARMPTCPVPGTVRRAEDYIRNHADQPIALTDLAAAAGCSVRSLQLSFRRFRDTTPAAAILLARLTALRHAITTGAAIGSVTAVTHQYGFTNPGRLTALCKILFGVSLADMLRVRQADAPRRK